MQLIRNQVGEVYGKRLLEDESRIDTESRNWDDEAKKTIE